MKKVYHYRNYDGTWSPWEKITLDLEDGPVIPVWWKGRLFLFWTTVVQKGREETMQVAGDDAISSVGGPVKLKIEVNLNWSEYYNGKWQEKRMSDFGNPVSFDVSDGKFDKNIISLKYNEFTRKAPVLLVSISYLQKPDGFVFNNPNNLPQRLRENENVFNKYYADFLSILVSSRFENNGKALTVYSENCLRSAPDQTLSKQDCATMLASSNPFYRITEFANHSNYLNSSSDSEPFFLNDHQHAFYVEIEKTPKRISDPKVYIEGFYIPVDVKENVIGIIPSYAEINFDYSEINSVDLNGNSPGYGLTQLPLLDWSVKGNAAVTLPNNNFSFDFDDITLTAYNTLDILERRGL